MFARNTASKCCKTLFGNVGLQRTHPCAGLFDQSKKFLYNSRAHSHQKRPMPSVYYYQNPFQWLKIKWQVLKLKNYDKEFDLKEFNRGSVQALSAVTNIVRDEKLDDLEGLLTPFALAKLRRDILVLWNDQIVRNIDLKLPDIKLAVPTRVHLRSTQLPYKKICDIDMWYMAMKWRDSDALLIIDFVARFNRDFTHNHYNSDWTISFFELRKYYVQSYKSDNQ